MVQTKRIIPEREQTLPERQYGMFLFPFGNKNDQLVNPDEPKKKKGMSVEDIARMDSEMESLERDMKTATDNCMENIAFAI